VYCGLVCIFVVLVIFDQGIPISSGMENGMVVEHHGGFILNGGNVLGVIVLFGLLFALLFIIESFSAFPCFVSILYLQAKALFKMSLCMKSLLK
jgi:hypothetical protein